MKFRVVVVILLVFVVRLAAAQPAPPNVPAGADSSLAEAFDRALGFVPVGSPTSVKLGVRELVRSVLTSQLATFPVGSSSGAFTYVYDERTRAFSRRTRTFGPWFAESASSLGRKGAFSVGTSVQAVRFDSLDGRTLEEGVFHTRSKRGAAGDWIGRQLNMSLTNHTVSVFGTYALSPTVDVGVIVPVVRVGFEAVAVNLRGETLTDSTLGSGAIPHVSASSLGDLQPRAKWNVVRSDLIDGAIQVDFRLPTGSVRQLTGTGSPRQKLSALMSLHHGAFEEHVNVSYTFRLSGASPWSALFNNVGIETESGFAVGGEAVEAEGATANELSYVFAGGWAVNHRATITMEVVGRYLRDSVAFRPNTGISCCVFGLEQYDYIDPVRAHINQVLIAVGGKFNVAGTSLVSAHVITSPTRAGLTIRPALVFGFEHAF